ncbi:AAA family ATPase [Ruminococcaceae bacterium OttesenSCG-928-A16]|nr:AAA family ATPase [Ruminococcaceae bacterium OttesenSCG-928-A16]
MQLDNVLGNEQTKAALKAALAAGKLPHAILLTAPAGCGRGFVARLLAADYLYPHGGPAAQAVVNNQSPELLTVQGEGKSGQIPVDSIRAVRQEIFHSSFSAGGRVVWIQDAHKMAAPAANALLKVLEEPPAGALFILTTGDAASMPQTIVSRCVIYPLAPAPLAACQQTLQAALPPEYEPHLPHLLSVLYGGRIGLGLRVLQNQARYATLQSALEAAKAAGERDRYTMLRVFCGYEGRADGDRDRREDLLADMTDIFESSLRGGAAPGLPALAPAVAAKLLPPVLQARLALRGNAAPKITFAALTARLANSC